MAQTGNKIRDKATGRFDIKFTKDELLSKLDEFIEIYIEDESIIYHGFELLKRYNIKRSYLHAWRTEKNDEDVIARIDLIREIQEHKISEIMTDTDVRNITGVIAFAKMRLGFWEEHQKRRLAIEEQKAYTESGLINNDDILEVGFEVVGDEDDD